MKKLIPLLAFGIAAAAAVLILAPDLNERRDIRQEAQTLATVLPESRPLAAFQLVDHNGTTFGNERFAGRWTILFMGFSNCGGVCPATLAKLGFAEKELPEGVDIVFLSVDPGRDTVPVLKKYVSAFGDSILGVTGDPAQIDNIAKSIGVVTSVSDVDGRYNVTHSNSIFLIDPDVALKAVMSPPHKSGTISKAVRQVISTA
jgi:protein SCO1/2